MNSFYKIKEHLSTPFGGFATLTDMGRRAQRRKVRAFARVLAAIFTTKDLSTVSIDQSGRKR